MITKHTATPYRVNYSRIDGSITHFHITAGEHGSLAPIAESMTNDRRGKAETEANAEFIVKACNAHYDLVAALEQMTARIQPDDEPFDPFKELVMMKEMARATLEKAGKS